MRLDVTHADIWAAGVRDWPGGLPEKLYALFRGGVGLEFLVARCEQAWPGISVAHWKG